MGFDFDSTLPRFTDLAVATAVRCACKGGVWHNVCVRQFIVLMVC